MTGSPYLRPSDAFDPMWNFIRAPRTFTSWQEEQRSWKETAYIHAGLSGSPTYRISGPEVVPFLNRICTNNVTNVQVGASTHAVLVTPKGHVIASGMLFRDAEDVFRTFIHKVILDYHLAATDFDVTVDDSTGGRFMFQIGGPRSLEIVEAALGEDLHDIRFFRHRTAPVGSRNLHVTRSDLMIKRLGMAGTLAYEVHGDAEDATAVYNAILDAGEAFGLKQLGELVYTSSHHTENGFPNTYIHYPPAYAEDPAMVTFMRETGVLTDDFRPWPDLRGSMGPVLEDRFITPFDANWQHAVKFDHDFIGREALEAVAEHPPRRMVTLEWNPEDILATFASQFGPDPKHPIMTFPGDEVLAGPMLTTFADKVLKDGELVGMSLGRMYSIHYGAMISIAPIRTDLAEIGNEVTVVFGDPGTYQKEIRATVSRFPYLDLPRNEKIDTATIPLLAG